MTENPKDSKIDNVCTVLHSVYVYSYIMACLHNHCCHGKQQYVLFLLLLAYMWLSTV